MSCLTGNLGSQAPETPCPIGLKWTLFDALHNHVRARRRQWFASRRLRSCFNEFDREVFQALYKQAWSIVLLVLFLGLSSNRPIVFAHTNTKIIHLAVVTSGRESSLKNSYTRLPELSPPWTQTPSQSPLPRGERLDIRMHRTMTTIQTMMMVTNCLRVMSRTRFLHNHFRFRSDGQPNLSRRPLHLSWPH